MSNKNLIGMALGAMGSFVDVFEPRPWSGGSGGGSAGRPKIAVSLGALTILGASRPASWDGSSVSRHDSRKLPHFQMRVKSGKRKR
jgi:hypothetical protein